MRGWIYLKDSGSHSQFERSKASDNQAYLPYELIKLGRVSAKRARTKHSEQHNVLESIFGFWFSAEYRSLQQ